MVVITKRPQKGGEIGSDSNENIVEVAQGLQKSSFPRVPVSKYELVPPHFIFFHFLFKHPLFEEDLPLMILDVAS